MLTVLSSLTSILQLVAIVAIFAVLYQFLKQQGRVLARLDAMEAKLGMAAVPTELEPKPLTAGDPFDSFELPDLSGKPVSLSAFRGQRILLVHWGPNCGFCEQLAADLAGLQVKLVQQRVQLLLVAHGSAEDNRRLIAEYHIMCPVLLLKGRPPVRPLLGLGTPSGYLIDTFGRVAATPAIGAAEVWELAQQAAQPAGPVALLGTDGLENSKIEREGIKPGTTAPSLGMPDLDGAIVDLSEYRGRKVLVLFSDIHCGPCEHLAPRIGEWYGSNGKGLSVVAVSRGGIEENRRKAREYGWRFRVVVQKQWEVSRAYGIFATPVAFLVDEDGRIAEPVAKGSEAILELAHRVERNVTA